MTIQNKKDTSNQWMFGRDKKITSEASSSASTHRVRRINGRQRPHNPMQISTWILYPVTVTQFLLLDPRPSLPRPLELHCGRPLIPLLRIPGQLLRLPLLHHPPHQLLITRARPLHLLPCPRTHHQSLLDLQKMRQCHQHALQVL